MGKSLIKRRSLGELEHLTDTITDLAFTGLVASMVFLLPYAVYQTVKPISRAEGSNYQSQVYMPEGRK